LIGLAQRRVLQQARAYPFSLLDVQLAQQTTGAGTTFLRWRNHDRSSMGVALWESLLDRPATPASLIDDLYAMELQRIALNMQISLLHTLGRQAQECASKAAQAEAAYLRVSTGMPRPFHPPPPRSHHEHALRRRGQHRFCAGLPRIPNGNDEPRRLLRLNVYFDNPIPKKDGEFEDRGGFWAPVELWHRDADHWKTCTRRACACWSKAARCGRMGGRRRQRAHDLQDRGARVGILPYRIESVTLSAKPAGGQ
jgi:hypothetical protein